MLRIQLCLAVALLPWADGARAGGATANLRLETSQLAVELRRADGAVVKIENRLTKDVKQLRSIPFQLITSKGEVTARDCRLLRSTHEARSATFVFVGDGLDVELGYRAGGPRANVVEKTLRITNRGQYRSTIDTIIME